MAKRKPMLVLVVFAVFGLPATALALTLRPAHKTTSMGVGRMPSATESTGVPEVGALYATSRTMHHGCTASVVQSPGRNTLVTAAHCVVGSGRGMVFAPGEHGGQTPYGRWIITAAYLEPRWLMREDAKADVAFLTVAPRTIKGVSTEIEQVTGAYDLGPTAVSRQRVTITGYPAGGANDPITCATKVYLTNRFPSFDCRGFVGGTSGSPWLSITNHGTQIVGVIGGLNQGGCYDYTSYSSRLELDVDTAYLRASDDEPADVAPQAGSDGC